MNSSLLPLAEEFSGLCYSDNTIADLEAALAGPVDQAECKAWRIGADDWIATITKALERKREELPVDKLTCGVAIGGATFFIAELRDGSFVAKFDDGELTHAYPAKAADWNALVRLWNDQGAGWTDARRVELAEVFFRERGWMPKGVTVSAASPSLTPTPESPPWNCTPLP